MAATILEEVALDENLDSLPTDEAAMSPSDVATSFEAPDTTASQQEEDIPEKYRGKSIREVVAMHQSAEKLIGSQGSEVGELRKVVDNYVINQIQSQSQPEPEPVEDVDFFEDPQKAVNRAIETHPEVVQARQAAQDMQRTASVQQLQAKHPDMAQVLQDPNFNTWVQESSIRRELFQRADQGYELGAADELISTFKERASVARQAVQNETVARQQAVKQASTGSTTGSGNAGSKRVYRRADIIKLMKTDPDRYEALSNEIMQAYQEGRVR